MRYSARLLMLLAVAVQGCARLPAKMPTANIYDYPNRVTQDQVVAAVDVLNAERTRAIFGVNLLRKQIQPLFIVVRNGSQQPYRFNKSDVDQNYLPAEMVAKWCFTKAVLPKVATGLMFVAGLGPLSMIPGSQIEASRDRNEQIRAICLAREIKDVTIGPRGELAGVMFVRAGQAGPIRVTLANEATAEPLTFEFPREAK